MADKEVTIIDSGINDDGDYFEECSDGSVKIYEYDKRVDADYLSYEKTSEGEEFWYYAPLDSQKAKAVKAEKLKDGTARKYYSDGILEYEYVPNKHKRQYTYKGILQEEMTADGHETYWDAYQEKPIKRFEYIPEGKSMLYLNSSEIKKYAVRAQRKEKATILEWNAEGKLVEGELADGTKLKGEYLYKDGHHEAADEGPSRYEKDCKYVLSVTYPDGRKLKARYSLSGELIYCVFYDKQGRESITHHIRDLAQKHIETEIQTEARIEQKNGRKHIINPTRSQKPLKNLGMKIKKIQEILEIAWQKIDDFKKGQLKSEQRIVDVVQNKARER